MKMRWPEFRIFLATLVGSIILFWFLMNRTGGVQADENNYLLLAKINLIGTAQIDGKPPLYYFFNYIIYHFCSYFLGPYKGISLLLFYLPFSVLSLAFLSQNVFDTSSKRWALFFILLFHPLFLIGNTQVMMESPLLSLITFLLALLFLSQKPSKSPQGERWTYFFIFLVSGLIYSVKLTGALAIPILLLPFLVRSKKIRLIVLTIFGLFVGYLGNKLSLHLLNAPAMQYFSFANLIRIKHLLGAMELWTTQLALWIFFVCPPIILGAVFSNWKNRKVSAQKNEEATAVRKIFLVCAFLTINLSLLLVCFSNYEIGLNDGRYHYPIHWAAILFFSIILADARPWVWLLCIVTTLPISYAYVGEREDRFFFWPEAAYSSTQEIDLHTFIGFPFWRWYLLRQSPSVDLCVYIPEEKQLLSAFWARRLLQTLVDRPQFYNEKNRTQFAECQGLKAIYSNILESYSPDCNRECMGSETSWRTCQWQVLGGYAYNPPAFSEENSKPPPKGQLKQQVAICFP